MRVPPDASRLLETDMIGRAILTAGSTFSRPRASLAAFAFVMLAFGVSSASAMPESCNEFPKIVAPRLALIEKLNNFKKKKPTAIEACKTMTSLIAADKKIMDWMVANKDWCQVPDEQLTQLKQASEQSNEFRGKACAAAANQAKQIEQLKRAQAQGGGGQPLPGAGVKLPQGAL